MIFSVGTASLSRIPLLLAQLHQELLRQNGNADLAVRGLVFQIAAELSREQRPIPVLRPRWLTPVEQLLAVNLSTPVDMRRLVMIAGVEADEIQKAFRHFLKRTPAEYLREKRIESARQLRVASRQTIAEIAAETGCYDQAHFCHQFRDVTGYSPREFRALMDGRSNGGDNWH